MFSLYGVLICAVIALTIIILVGLRPEYVDLEIANKLIRGTLKIRYNAKRQSK